MSSPARIIFVSANSGGGGSEELWVQTISHLQKQGHVVHALTTWGEGAAARIEQLIHNGVPHLPLKDTWLDKVRHRLFKTPYGGGAPLRRQLRALKAQFVVFNSGTSLDGLPLLEVIASSGIPYFALTHLVSTDNWPTDKAAEKMRRLFTQARNACFVSQHNQALFQTQIGAELANTKIVRNPYLVGRDAVVPWPESDTEYRLAFPARIHPRTKGHDLLLEILSTPRWRERNVKVSLFGKGPWQQTLEAAICSRGLTNLTFRGHVSDISAIWREHHALILPSRHEGLPICIVEAMMAGRPCIVNNAGGSAELLEDGVTGFISRATTEESLAEAMERAWASRAQWQEMGAAAAISIRAVTPADPAAHFADEILTALRD